MDSVTSNVVLPPAVRRRMRGYRVAALVILLAGLAGAGAVYWQGSRNQVDLDDPSMLGFNRAADRQMGVLYGKQGQLIEDLDDWIKQPGSQALLIAAAAAVVAFGCFQYSRLLESEARDAAAGDEPAK